MNSNHHKQARAPQHFNPLARYLHWLMAIMILTMLFIGAAMMTSLHHRIWLVDVHRPLGIAILLLALIRPPTGFIAGSHLFLRSSRLQVLAAKASHWALYALMLAMPLLGWAQLSAAGVPIVMFEGLNLPAITPTSPLLLLVSRCPSPAC